MTTSARRQREARDRAAMRDFSLPADSPALSRTRPTRHSATRLLLGFDLVALGSAFIAAHTLTEGIRGAGQTFGGEGAFVFLAMLPVWILIIALHNLYSREEERPDHTVVDDLGALFNSVTSGTWAFVAASWLILNGVVHISGIVAFWALSFVALVIGRLIAGGLINRRVSFMQNVVIVGAGDVGQLVARKMVDRHGSRLNLVGFVDDDPRPRQEGLEHVALLGPIERLPALIDLLDVDRVMIAFSRADSHQLVALIRALKDYDVQVDIVPRLFETFGTRVGLHTVEGLPLVGLPPLRLSRPALAVKRTMDILVAGTALLVFSPLVALVAILIKRDSPGPLFYRHTRVGRDGEQIGVFKFRTMRSEFCRGEKYGGASAEEAFAKLMANPVLKAQFEEDYKLADDPRVTKVGSFLRRSSLDELPQLFNVLKGDLSLVGPRPITEEELPRYGGESAALLNVKPGLTGYWQISGRSVTGYHERVRLDLAYVTGWSLKTDISIMVKTFGKVVLQRQGAF